MPFRARLTQINDYTTLIDDAGSSTAYLIRGTERALLIDTLNGVENVAELVRTITGLPVMVLNTHGHIDHIGGNHFFPEVFLHPGDNDVYREHLAILRDTLCQQGITPIPTGDECTIRPMEAGTVINLGGRQLEVVHIPGHTAGSIAVLDRDARLLYTGDAINSQEWMQLDHSTMLSEYLASLNALDRLRPAFDGLYGGHASGAPTPAAYIDTMKQGVREILAGDTARDDDWPWFFGVARRHMLGEKAWILYDEGKVG